MQKNNHLYFHSRFHDSIKAIQILKQLVSTHADHSIFLSPVFTLYQILPTGVGFFAQLRMYIIFAPSVRINEVNRLCHELLNEGTTCSNR